VGRHATSLQGSLIGLIDGQLFGEVWKMITETKEERVARWKAEHERIVAIAKLHVGDRVVWPRTQGFSLIANIPMEIIKVDFDHTHGHYPHTEECFCEEKIEYTCVINMKEDGSADYRGRFHSRELIKV